MARKQRLMIRLTDEEKQRLEYAAQVKGVSMSEIIQDYCKRLPKPPEKNKDASLRRTSCPRFVLLVGIHEGLRAELVSAL